MLPELSRFCKDSALSRSDHFTKDTSMPNYLQLFGEKQFLFVSHQFFLFIIIVSVFIIIIIIVIVGVIIIISNRSSNRICGTGYGGGSCGCSGGGSDVDSGDFGGCSDVLDYSLFPLFSLLVLVANICNDFFPLYICF